MKKIVSEDTECVTEEQKHGKMRSLALCIYVATYFRLNVQGVTNSDCEDLYFMATPSEKEALSRMWSEKQPALEEEILKLGDIYEVFNSFGSYKMVCDKCDESSSDKLNLLISYKQIFSVPWLLCCEQLLDVKYKGQI